MSTPLEQLKEMNNSIGVAGGSTVADDTLDTRLEAQREWFLENSGMSVIL